MRQLSGVDALHILEENDRQHMHTVKIAVLGDRASGPVTADEVIAWARERLPRIPPLRWRVHKIPLGLGRPVFVDSGPIDVDEHIRIETLPAPGGEVELEDCVARIASIQLPRHKPLWDMTIVDGLADGNLALVFKLHHSIMDGQASVRFFEIAFDADPDSAVSATAEIDKFPAPPAAAESKPRAADLVGYALKSQAKLYGQLPKVAKRTVASVKQNRSRKSAEGPAIINPLSGPSTRFNHWPTPNRVYADVTFPLADLKALRVATGSTLNEVLTALCGGAMRRYLEAAGELPDRCLNACTPVSLRQPDERDNFCNRTSYWYVSLGTTGETPAERLEIVKDSLAAARTWAEGDVELFSVWQDYYLLFGFITLKLLTTMEKLTKRPAFNAIVSNVRGPQPLSLAGAPVTAVRSMGPITRSLGINFTMWTYRGDFAIGVHSCSEFLAEPREMTRYLAEELATMMQAFGVRSAGESFAKLGQ